MASGAMGDMATGAFLAGAISAALLKRERGGGGFVVDASLLATGVWLMALNVAAAAGGRPVYFHSQLDRSEPSNPLVNNFRTRDDRYISFCLLQPSWAWPELCERMGREDLLEVSTLPGSRRLAKYSRELTVILDEIFATNTLAEWQSLLANTRGVWGDGNLTEAANVPQVVANGYVQPLEGAEHVPEAPRFLVSAPVQFDEESPTLRVAPELGGQTEEVLLEMGYDWPAIIALKEQGAIT